MNRGEQFKDSLNRWITFGLFVENAPQKDKANSPFSLSQWDVVKNGVKYPSLRKIYMELEDVTEYRIATEVLGGWNHWLSLCQCKWFQPIVQEWREELEVRLRSKAIKQIVNDAVSGESKEKLSSAKWLAERKWMNAEEKRAVSGTKKKDNNRHKLELIDNEVDAHITLLEDYQKRVNES